MSAPLLPPPTKWVFDTNTDPPAYTRLMADPELFMHRNRQATDGAGGECCIGIDFTSSLTMEELRDRAWQALDKLRFLCPIIACTVQDTIVPKWRYTPSADREAWLDLAFVVEDRGLSFNTSEFIRSIDLTRLPYTDRDGTATYFRVYLLTTSEEGHHGRKKYGLYVHSIHSIINAGSALGILNLMCEWTSGNGPMVTVIPSDEWKNLPLDSIIANGGSSKKRERPCPDLLQNFAKRMARMLLPPHRFPPRPSNMAGPSFRHLITLSEPETATIVAQAKRLGVSTSALFQAAHCLAQIKMNPKPPRLHTDSSHALATFYLERFTKSPVDLQADPLSCFSMMPLRFSLARPFIERTEKKTLVSAAKKIQQHLDNPQGDPYLPEVSMPEKKFPHGVPQLDCGFKNVGVVEDSVTMQHGDISIHNIYLGLRETPLMNVHMWMMHSKLHFQVQGAASCGEDCMRWLLEETVRIGSLITRNANL